MHVIQSTDAVFYCAFITLSLLPSAAGYRPVYLRPRRDFDAEARFFETDFRAALVRNRPADLAATFFAPFAARALPFVAARFVPFFAVFPATRFEAVDLCLLLLPEAAPLAFPAALLPAFFPDKARVVPFFTDFLGEDFFTDPGSDDVACGVSAVS